jgi:hypothetical protein
MAPPQQDKQENLRGYKPNQHGVNGAYVGGDWVDMEDCATQFSIGDGSCGNNCEVCRTYSMPPCVRTGPSNLETHPPPSLTCMRIYLYNPYVHE